MIKTFMKNRSKFSASDLAPYEDTWVAFTADGTAIIDWNKSVPRLVRRIEKQGYARTDYRLQSITTTTRIAPVFT